ncbi:hypothetical protein Y10_24940 [Neptunitalea sp. Y10]|uniref:HTH luxR-type domain-containing protein n=2 Tax=Neptunitalea lumnitzerae TaxID=2965509 RepID=A0ABQ5MLE3_9FLAO|nr:hypothetical protein Y10_24940 [Neptunitalea sp. Y10]
MDSAYYELPLLIEQANQEKKTATELLLLDRQCHYFYNIADLEKLITSAKILEQKATEYQNTEYQSAANLYISESYSMNDMPEKALETLNKAESFIKETALQSNRTFYIQSNILLSQANIYYDNKEYNKAIAKIKRVINSGEFLKDSTMYNQFQYVNYSNLANLYIKFNIDSAEYYVQKSIALEDTEYPQININGANFFILGKVYEHQNNTHLALTNYLKAYKIISKYRDALNKGELYKGLSKVYAEIGKQDSAAYFNQKLKEYEHDALENKYNSLKKIIKEESSEEENNQTSFTIILISAITIIAIVSIGMFYYFKKRKTGTITNPETSQEKLNKNFDLLIELIKKDDPAFLTTFEEIFPNFRKNLLNINPELNISEITFCALLKLNLSTKKIAQYTFIETRTVQNKKHRIRKKLNIPKEIDTYNWFSSI